MQNKSVEWAYPTSPDANRLGFGTLGCWTVNIGPQGEPLTAVAGYHTREMAIAAATEFDAPWSFSFLFCNPEFRRCA